MRITVATIGSRGDLEPAVALAVALRARGHSVTLVGPPELALLSDACRLKTQQLEPDLTEAGAPGARRNLWTRIRGISATRRHVIRQFDKVVDACHDTDMLVCSMTFSPAALSIHQRFGTAVCLYSLTPPYVPTGATPNPWLPGPALGPAWNRMTYTGFEQLLWQPIRRHVNRWRRQRLSLPAIPTLRYFDHLRDSGIPWLLAVSRVLFPPADDWPSRVHVTGRWFAHTERGFAPPERVSRFLQDGSVPICVTFGSNPIADQHGVLQAVSQALDSTRQRAILVGGSSRLGEGICLGERVLSVSSLPYDWLFPRIRLAVHHGGAGTTAHSLRAGIPSIVVPTREDQRAFGRRLHELGVSPRPLPLRRLTGRRMTEALQVILRDDRCAARAAELARCVGAENGVGDAIRRIEEHGTREAMTRRSRTAAGAIDS